MPKSRTRPIQSPSTPVLSRCPDCNGRLAILRIIAGKASSEYWAMRCTKCDGIHLDIVKPSPPSLSTEAPA